MFKDSNYIGLAQMSSDERERLRHVNDVHEAKVEVRESSLLDQIFAPHPLSGNPCSDLFFDLNADPNVKDFIQRELQSSRIVIEKTDNVDEALDFVKSQHESVDNYINRLKGYYSQSSTD